MTSTQSASTEPTPHGDPTSSIAAAVAVPARSRWDVVSELVSKNAVLAALVIAIVFFWIDVPDTFPTMGNARAMLSSESVILILALGATLTLRLGDFDLSFGANMNMSAVVIAVLTVNHGVNPALAAVVGVLIGVAIGAINALLVVTLGLNSFVATLGVMTAVQGVGYWITNSNTIVGVPGSLTTFATKQVAGLPTSIWYSWIILVAFWIVYEFTVFGRYLLFVGGNRRAARLAGVRTDRVRWAAYVVSGTLFGLVGVILVGQIGSGDPTIGSQYLLPPLAGAFLGSTTIQPGRFNAIGTVVGVYLLMVVSSGLQLLGAASWVSDFFNGVALVIAIAVARLSRRTTASAGLG